VVVANFTTTTYILIGCCTIGPLLTCKYCTLFSRRS